MRRTIAYALILLFLGGAVTTIAANPNRGSSDDAGPHTPITPGGRD